MIYQSNKAGFWLGFAIAVPLAIFNAWRDWDLFANVLPASQILAAFFGLAALDGGFIGWSFGYVKGKGDQRGIAATLSVICFLGSILGMFLDLYISLLNKGFLDAQKGNIYVGAIVLICTAIAINTGGGVLYALQDPKTKQDIRDQKAHDKINSLADAQIEQHAAMYAPEFARAKVDLWMAQARMIHGLAPTSQSMLPPAASIPALPPAQVQQPQQQPAPEPPAWWNPLTWFGGAQQQPAPAPVTVPQAAPATAQQAQLPDPAMMAALVQMIQQMQQQQPPTTQQPAASPVDFYNDLVNSIGGPNTSPLAAAPTAQQNGNGAH